MTDETIFTQTDETKTSGPATDQTATNQNNQVNQPDFNAVFKDKLNGITNDQGEPKYTDVMTALEALKHSQEHIRTLESENKSLKTEQVKAATMEEALERLSANRDQTTQQTQGKQEIDVEELRRIAREENMAITREQQTAANMKSVSDTLISKFGEKDKAAKAFSAKADELGVSTDFLQSLAATSPKAVLTYFNASPTQSINKNLEGTVNTESQFTAPKERKVGGVMYGASSQQVKDAWAAAREAVLEEINNN